jgi:bacterioferritin
MQGNKTILQHLNTILGNELVAINQYLLHSRMFRNWGMQSLAKKEYEESVDEMKHADRLIERILFLDGLPNLQDYGKLMIGENTEEILRCDLKLEMKATADLRAAIIDCEKVQDFVSRDILSDILTSEEDHIDWIETQLTLIEKVGIQNYQQSGI